MYLKPDLAKPLELTEGEVIQVMAALLRDYEFLEPGMKHLLGEVAIRQGRIGSRSGSAGTLSDIGLT